MKRYDKLIFVSTDNTATSPMAEAVAQSRFALEDILVESRGLVVLFPEPVNPKAEAILKSHGLTMKDHTSRLLTADDFDERTLIITIGREVRDKLINTFTDAQNVYVLSEFVGEQEDISHPYGGDLADYGHCYDRLSELVAQLADRLEKQED